MARSETEHKIEMARERLVDAVEDLAELGWSEDKIQDELAHACKVAWDDGLFSRAD